MIKVLKIESHFINLFVNLNAIGIDDFKIMTLIELNVVYVLMILQQLLHNLKYPSHIFLLVAMHLRLLENFS